MKTRILGFVLAVGLLVTLACNLQALGGQGDQAGEAAGPAVPAPVATAGPTPDLSSLPANLLRPGDLVYRGAFRLPDEGEEAQSWEYGGQALTYRPDGDPGGEADGYPGSLFGTGHDQFNYVSEISIPAPSLSRDVEQLNVATTLQGFSDIRGGLFNPLNELPRVGLQYLPPQAGQSSGKLYMAWGQHFQWEGEPSFTPSHAWSEVDLSQPDTQGAWWVGDESLYRVNGYMFEIPQAWADAYLGGARLATGRYRDGGWSGRGPNLYAVAPWQAGNPPAPGTRLPVQTMLGYADWEGPDENILDNYQDADEWEGGAWLTAGDRTAVVFVGTKGAGDYWWYGSYSPNGDGVPCTFNDPGGEPAYCFNADGSNCPPELARQCPGYVPESRGWWSSRWDAVMLFYDPADFAAVLDGTLEPYEPQPYAVMDIDENLFLNATIETTYIGAGDQRHYRVGEMAYDRERGLLYVFELFADGAKPVVHVWEIQQ